MLFVRNVTFMSRDPRRLADFWCAALGLSERRDEPHETIAADAEWRYPRFTFQQIDRDPAQPGPVHLDLTADDRIAEIARLTECGAREGRSVAMDDGWTWTVMTDPDGNEFCVTDP